MADFFETSVSLDEGPSFKAWTTGARWNGWATPFFEKEEADRVITLLGSLLEDQGERAYFDEAKDAYVVERQYAPDIRRDVFDAETIETPKGTRKVYAIGAYSYTWWTE